MADVDHAEVARHIRYSNRRRLRIAPRIGEVERGVSSACRFPALAAGVSVAVIGQQTVG